MRRWISVEGDGDRGGAGNAIAVFLARNHLRGFKKSQNLGNILKERFIQENIVSDPKDVQKWMGNQTGEFVNSHELQNVETAHKQKQK